MQRTAATSGQTVKDGCPTVGVRTGASFVRTGETCVLVDRLPPEPRCAESDDDVRALAVFMEAIGEAQSRDRHSVRDQAARQFDTDRIVASIITAVNKARLGGGIQAIRTIGSGDFGAPDVKSLGSSLR